MKHTFWPWINLLLPVLIKKSNYFIKKSKKILPSLKTLFEGQNYNLPIDHFTIFVLIKFNYCHISDSDKYTCQKLIGNLRVRYSSMEIFSTKYIEVLLPKLPIWNFTNELSNFPRCLRQARNRISGLSH